MPSRRPHAHDPNAEEATEAIIEGDLGFRRGTAQAALRNLDFRVFWGGTFASNIGTWRQTVLLGAFGHDLRGAAVFRGLLSSPPRARLLSIPTGGGVRAAVANRRK